MNTMAGYGKSARRKILQRLESGPLESGLANCHHKGLNSVVLRTRVDGSLSRIFYATAGCTMSRVFGSDGNFTLGPHNHDKEIRFCMLFGDAWHAMVVRPVAGACDRAMRLYRREFTSGLESGEFALGSPECGEYNLLLLSMDETIMTCEDVHTVICGDVAAWHCDEGPRMPITKHIWSVGMELVISADGLYVPMSDAELESARQMLIEKMRERMAL